MDGERSRVDHALDLVNLSAADGSKLPGELSGGMQKRVALARALVGDHRYMLYDEPTTGLDPINTSVIGELIHRCHREDDRETDVLVTHDLDLAFTLADRAADLAGGEVRARGTPTKLLESSDPFVKRFLERKAADGTGPRARSGSARSPTGPSRPLYSPPHAAGDGVRPGRRLVGPGAHARLSPREISSFI